MASNYSYPDFVNQLKKLNIKKKGKKPKVSPNKFYPFGAEAQTTELLKGELDGYAAKLSRAALDGGVEAIYAVLGAPPDSFREEVEKISRDIDNFQVKAFANFSEMVVGERYFPSSDEKELILRTWNDNFVNLCKSTNEEMRKRSAGIISDGVLNGRNMKELVKELQNNCADFSRSKAELIATTEVGKLNTAMNRAQSQAAGIDYYEWSAAMDGRTRESHALMNGKICAWGKDDVYYEWETDENGKRKLVEKPRPKNAYKGAPGTDFRCRCVALPYVPEYEDDYEEERPKGEIRGVTQENPVEKAEPVKELVPQRDVDEVTKKFFDALSSFGFISGEQMEAEKKALNDSINRLPEKLRRKWVDTAKNIKIVKKDSDPSQYIPDKDCVAFSEASAKTIIHEISHAMAAHSSSEAWVRNHASTVLANNIKSITFIANKNMKDRCLQINIGSTAYNEFVKSLNSLVKNNCFASTKEATFRDMLKQRGIEIDDDVVKCASDWLSISGYDDMGWGHRKSYQRDYKNLCNYFLLPGDQPSRAALSVELGAEIPVILSCKGGKEFLDIFLPKTLKQYEDNIVNA